jgi:DNA-binding protein H-NS
MAIDLSKLSPQELKDLISAAEKQVHVASKERVAAVRAKIEGILKAEGLALEHVFTKIGGKVKSLRKPIAPKYASLAEPTLTWSGRGKRPLWFVKALKDGIVPEALLINGSPKEKRVPKKAAAKPAVKKAVAKKAAAKKTSKK